MVVQISLSLIMALSLSLSVFSEHARVNAALPERQLKVNNQPENRFSQQDKIELNITPMLYSFKVHDLAPTDRYKIEDPKAFALMMTNRTNQTMSIIFTNQYLHFRPRLLKDGNPVQYRKEIRQAVQETEKHFRLMGSSVGFPLLPDRPHQFGYLDLKDWYDTLEAAHYELTLKHRFGTRRRPVESNTATFEVLP
jgi:hypothetical protein